MTRLVPVLAVLGLAAASCGPAPKQTCNPSMCGGCCDSDGFCQQGTATNACGNGGALCSACSSSQMCSAGACIMSSTGGGSGTAGGSGSTAGGTGATAGGTGATAGGSGVTAGGTGATAGGTGATAGGSGGTAGGTGGTAGGSGGTAGGGTAGGTGGTAGGTGGTAGGTGGTAGGTAGGAAGGTGGTAGGSGIRDVTIPQAKLTAPCAERVRIRNVVVTGIDDLDFSGANVLTRFWVVDPANPADVLFVEKFYNDLPTGYVPVTGDLLDLEGYMHQLNTHQERSAYRPAFKNQFACPGGTTTGNILITRTGAMSLPADFMVFTGFGNAQGGTAKPNPQQASRRVFIPGPLTITQGFPPAMRVSATSGRGYEVTGGILVADYKTFRFDGGCPWRDYADGGTVTFPNGIRGIWDTYSHAPCYDGTTSCSLSTTVRDAGFVPSTTNDFTYVLFPQSCADVPGIAVP